MQYFPVPLNTVLPTLIPFLWERNYIYASVNGPIGYHYWCLVELSQQKQKWYCQPSNIRCTKSLHFIVFHLILQLPLPNPFNPGVKLRMKMLLEQRQQVMLQLHLRDQQFYNLQRYNLNQRLDSKYYSFRVSISLPVLPVTQKKQSIVHLIFLMILARWFLYQDGLLQG